MPGFVYIIQMVQATVNALPPPPHLIKVGRTVNLPGRRSALNTGNPYRLEYVQHWPVSDAKEGERVAHDRLVNLHLRAYPDYGGGREWFRLPAGGLHEAQLLIRGALEHLLR